jgi:FdhE protein
MAGYLALMARVARAQAAAYGARAAPAVDGAALDAARDHGMPPLGAISHRRHPAWREDLRAILLAVQDERRDLVVASSLLKAPEATLDDAADRLLAGVASDDEAAEVPFVGAALQVYFTRLAATLPVACLARVDVPAVCPACATRPVASVVRIAAEGPNLRYLVCALCHVEWNLPRIKCSSCGKEAGLQYFSLRPQSGQTVSDAWLAEACDDCKSYLKILHEERDPALDPVADDLASLALDMLVDERGYRRSGPNFLLHPGSE